MIRVERLYKSFGSVHALKNVSFSVKKGEVVGLLGPNGAGKTTTMRIITGFLKADKGAVYVDDVPVTENTLKVKSKIGYLPENAPLYPEMEVTEFLEYIAAIRGISPAERRARIREMINVAGLKDVVGRSIGKLSRGYRQRVGLAQALIHHPPILILDEPTAGLDPNQIIEIRGLIKKIGEKRTVILSTHIMQEVEATCDRALIISGGELVGDGTLADLAAKGSGMVKYRAVIKAKRCEIEAGAEGLKSLKIVDFACSPEEEWQKVIFHSSDGAGGEDIFRWIVSNGWLLKELHEEKSSLEDVFRTMTQDAS